MHISECMQVRTHVRACTRLFLYLSFSLYIKNREFILISSIPVQQHKFHSNFSSILICNFFLDKPGTHNL